MTTITETDAFELIGFLDDTEIVVDTADAKPDIFAFGGYFIRGDKLDELQRRIQQVKEAYGLPGYAPVKWNLRDKTLQNFYQEVNRLEPTLVDDLLRVSDSIRQDLLALLAELDAKVLISARYDVANRQATSNDYYTWAFENLLQRIGLMVKDMHKAGNQANRTTLVVDWPQGGIGKQLFDIHYGGYHFGKGLVTKQDYFSGPLKELRFAESLTHGSTLHLGPLQLADLVTGCCRDFLSWAHKGTNLQRIRGSFDVLISQFYRNRAGRLNNCGFKVARADSLDIEMKIAEYLNVVT